MTTASILISNYNYGKYLGEAIDSVLQQTFGDLEVIVVDDGSTDDSQRLLNSYAGLDDRVKVLFKDNGGQLSCLNAGFYMCKGDYVFLLDSDDIYKPTYIEEAVTFYRQNPECDFLFVNREYFDQKQGMVNRHKENFDFGITSLVTLYSRTWLGDATSALSLRRSILEKMVPLPYEEDWFTRADDCVIWSASIAGARKYYLHQPLVNYRVHGNNFYHDKKRNKKLQLRYNEAVNRLFKNYQEKLNMPTDKVVTQLLEEFQNRPVIDRAIYRKYRRAVRYMPLSFLKKRLLKYKLLLIYLNHTKKISRVRVMAS